MLDLCNVQMSRLLVIMVLASCAAAVNLDTSCSPADKAHTMLSVGLEPVPHEIVLPPELCEQIINTANEVSCCNRPSWLTAECRRGIRKIQTRLTGRRFWTLTSTTTKEYSIKQSTRCSNPIYQVWPHISEQPLIALVLASGSNGGSPRPAVPRSAV